MVPKPVQPTDKRAYEVVTIRGTKDDAEAKRRELITELQGNPRPAPAKDTLSAWLTTWADSSANTTDPNYLRVIHTAIAQTETIKVGKATLAAITLSNLNTETLEAAYETFAANHKADTIRNLHTTIARALKAAVKRKLIATNPAAGIKMPKRESTTMNIYDGEQLAILDQACKDEPYGPAIRLAAATGMRQSEIIGLRQADTHLTTATNGKPEGYISITQKAYKPAGGQTIFSRPKTKGSRRKVRLPQMAIKAIQDQQAKLRVWKMAAGESWTDLGLLFCEPDGQAIWPWRLTRAFQRIAAENNLPRIRFHDLRHSIASLLLARGVNPKIVQELLGHATIQITLDLYSHVLPDIQEQATSAIDEAIRLSPTPLTSTSRAS